MRAIRCETWGKASDLRWVEVAEPAAPSRDQVKVKVAAAGVNFADTLMIAGQYQVKPDLPFTPGFEFAGTVVEIGAGVTHVTPGDRVMGIVDYGAFADLVIVSAASVFPMPAAMDVVTAAGFPIAYATSYGAYAWKAKLQAGDLLLVHGAAGGVGLTAVEIGKALGATVIATAGGPEKLAIAKEHGAGHLIDYKTADIRTEVKRIAGSLGRAGVDVVYDPVGGACFEASLRCVDWNGRILIVGFAGGQVPQAPTNILLVKNIDVLGFFFGSYRQHRPDLVQQAFVELNRLYADGALRPHISHRLPMSEVAAAFDLLASRRSTGKVVLTLV